MEAFGTALVVIALVAVLAAAVSFWGSGRIYRGLGRSGGLGMDSDSRRREPAPHTPAGKAVAREEIRQMLEAKSARRQARGERPLDVDAELEQLMRPASPRDPALREEVRQLVVARNERRLRQGKEPLDIDAEVERQLRDLNA